jgi:parallel beta-helix repeat protein
MIAIATAVFVLQPLSYTGDALAAPKEDVKSTGTSSSPSSSCVTYEANESVITITCKNAVRLSDIDKQLNNAQVLKKESGSRGGAASAKVWSLNAGIVIEKGSTLVIDSKDTKWLKIIADGTTAHAILVHGSLRIDSVKVTSWNPNTNDYGQSYGSRESSGRITHPGAPRPYMRIESDTAGTLNITNSEIAYLGYEAGFGAGTSGLHYSNAGNGSMIKNNDIHHLYFGLYTNNVGGLVIENNKVHDSGHYGLDPHTGTHDMIIRNNIVYGNNGSAIICSLDCYNILIEGNKVYNNTGAGIAFSRNMFNSIARNNYIHDQERAIHVSQSHDNEIYNNTISNAKTAITLTGGSAKNDIYHNTIINTSQTLGNSTDNQKNNIHSNRILANSSDTTKQ